MCKPIDRRLRYEEKNLPVVVTDWTADWAAHHNWAVDRLANDHNDVRFEVPPGRTPPAGDHFEGLFLFLFF